MRPTALLSPFLLIGLTLVACQSNGGAGTPDPDSGTPDPDVTAPTVMWTAPDHGAPLFIGMPATMTGTAEDETELAGVTLTAAGLEQIEATLDGAGNWTAELTPVAMGSLEVTATATDAAGNSAIATRTFTVHGNEVEYHVETVSFAAGGTGGAVRLFRVTGGIQDRNDHVPEATVSVNDTVLPFLDREPYMSFQGTPLKTGTILAGDTLDLRVEVGDDVVTTEWTIPHAPTVTGPADGTHFAIGEPVRITWEAPEDPSYFLVLLLGDVAGGGWSGRIDGAARSWDMEDVSRLPDDGSEVRVIVRAMNVVTSEGFTGPAAEGSSVTGENSSSNLGAPTFTVGP
mgnify:CR=1 FL=1